MSLFLFLFVTCFCFVAVMQVLDSIMGIPTHLRRNTDYLTEYIIKAAMNGQTGSSHSLRALILDFSNSNGPFQQSHYYCINDNFRLPNDLPRPCL